ncbi:MAG: flagellar basal body P-ring protein FlgI [Planctomycetes bacterium]|nr:flagellar basal body P-ring protein FlgI [Planctomycetota bacterium]
MHHTRLAILVLTGAALCAQEPAVPPPAAALPQSRPTAPSTPLVTPIGAITSVHGALPATLQGMGVVVGLMGTGDGAKATRQALENFIQRNGLNIAPGDSTSGGAALVMVRVELPPFTREGARLNAQVAVLGDATSLYGGQLIECPLTGPDGQVYAVASGSLSVGGFSVGAKGGTRIVRNHTTTATVPEGGLVVRRLASRYLTEDGHLELLLSRPNEADAVRIAAVANAALQEFGCRVGALDRSLVRIELPVDQRTEDLALRVYERVRGLAIQREAPMNVVIDEARGVLIAGEGVRISPCVVSLSDLTISVVSDDEVVQPNPWARGRTEVVNRTRIEVTNNNVQPQPLQGGATVGDLMANLRALELTPRQLIEVFTHLHEGGYLHAPLLFR